MQDKWLARALVSGLLMVAAGCPDVKTDPGETEDDFAGPGPIAEFDPSNRVIPFPNNLLLDPMTGRVNLPASCAALNTPELPSSMATRVNVLNKLDGFGVYQTVMNATFSEPIDMSSLAGHVFMYKRATGMTPVDPASAVAIPVMPILSMTTRFSADCSTASDPITQVVFVPMVPLEQKSVYTLALTAGIKTTSGADYGASFTWSIVREDTSPVELADPTCNPGTGSCEIASDRTPLEPGSPDDLDGDGIGDDLEQLNGIALLWRAHSPAMTFLRGTGKATSDIILAWEFKTQTTTDPLDPAVATSPAATVNAMGLTGPIDGVTTPVPITGVAANRAAYPFQSCTDPNDATGNTQCWLKMALGGGISCTAQAACDTAYATGSAVCGSVGCTNVGGVHAGRVRAKQYQAERPNSAVPAKPIPGAWSDPIAPALVKEELVTALIILPASAAPGTGRQVVVYQHGLTSNKETVFALAPQLAGIGFATVAIDAVAHGSRAVQNSVDAALGCGGTPTVAAAPQCFSGFISADLGATRDNVRQTVVDHHSLIAALKACGTTGCGALTVDVNHIEYVGHSLGGIIGTMTHATSADTKAAVLSVPGAGWIDLLENTQTKAFSCTLVNALIMSGTLQGEISPPPFTTGLCTTDAWKTQPGYRQFAAIGRWVMDPADPANFTRKLAVKRFFLQEVNNDQVVPNLTTQRLGAMVGLTSSPADCGTPNTAPPPAMLPTLSLLTNPMTNKYLKYTNSTAAACAPAGNTFEHASLLRPSGTGADGRLGTQRMQTDALTFLNANR